MSRPRLRVPRRRSRSDLRSGAQDSEELSKGSWSIEAALITAAVTGQIDVREYAKEAS